jgi:hypothetical protein
MRSPARQRLVELEIEYYKLCDPYDLHAIKPLLRMLMRKCRSMKAKEEALNRLIREAMAHPLKEKAK